jgi:hypothetical protein
MQKILLGMDNKAIPLQLLQLVKSPDFGILMMLPSDQLLGIYYNSFFPNILIPNVAEKNILILVEEKKII